MKKFLMLTLVLMMGLLLCGCTDSREAADVENEDFIVVGFSQVGAESDWRVANTLSMQQALSEKNGYKLIIDDAQNKQERQITAIRNFIQQEVDYIVLAPTTETGWDTVLAEAKAAGIPVILVDRMIKVKDEELFTCWVGSDFYLEGKKAVEWMEEYFGDREIRILHLQGNYGTTAQLGRTKGLDDGLANNPGWTLVHRQSGEFVQGKGQELVEECIAGGIQFDVVYSENDNMAYGAIDALKAAGLTPGEDVFVVSFDASHNALQLTLAGEISFDVECNPLHGPRVEDIIQRLEKGSTPPKYTYVDETAFDSETITQEMIDQREY
ncbi:MAG: ABC transporter substrate-binding protein [Clostridiales bacterium]|nr:ABC transporter substrate-binding protein [Clostridiales bacterium]